jgi:hypothetical protein
MSVLCVSMGGYMQAGLGCRSLQPHGKLYLKMLLSIICIQAACRKTLPSFMQHTRLSPMLPNALSFRFNRCIEHLRTGLCRYVNPNIHSQVNGRISPQLLKTLAAPQLHCEAEPLNLALSAGVSNIKSLSCNC